MATLVRGDSVVGKPVPSLEERFSQSQIVAVVRIESGETELYTDQIYKARVAEPIKGVQKDEVLYFWAGNIGAEGYAVGEIYLMFLRPGTPFLGDGAKVADAHVKWRSSQPESRFDQNALLYSTACPHSPIPLRYRNLLDRWKAVFFVPGGCVALPAELRAETIGARGDPFLVWVAQDPLLRFLKELNARVLVESEGTPSSKAPDRGQASQRKSFSKTPLAEWLTQMQFIGLGRVEKAEVETNRIVTRSTVRIEETWWGSVSPSITFDGYLFPRWPGDREPLGEGQRFVLMALRPSTPSGEPIFEAIPVLRFNGADSFRFPYHAEVGLPPTMYVVSR